MGWHMLAVLTVDQRDSRRGRDKVPALLDRLAGPTAPSPPLRAFQRTAGDEVQAVLDDPEVTVDTLAVILRSGGWGGGGGVGAVGEPLPQGAPAGNGPADGHPPRAGAPAQAAPPPRAGGGGGGHPAA